MVREIEVKAADGNSPKTGLIGKNGRPEGRKRRIGLKYCGGCNPHYDRIVLAEEIKARLGEEIEWVMPEDDNPDLLLAIEGCETACADLSPYGGIEIYLITCPEHAEQFISDSEKACCGPGWGERAQ